MELALGIDETGVASPLEIGPSLEELPPRMTGTVETVFNGTLRVLYGAGDGLRRFEDDGTDPDSGEVLLRPTDRESKSLLISREFPWSGVDVNRLEAEVDGDDERLVG